MQWVRMRAGGIAVVVVVILVYYLCAYLFEMYFAVIVVREKDAVSVHMGVVVFVYMVYSVYMGLALV